MAQFVYWSLCHDIGLYVLRSIFFLDLNFLHLVHVGVDSIIISLLLLLSFSIRLLNPLLGLLGGPLLLHPYLGFLRSNFGLEISLCVDYLLNDDSLLGLLKIGCLVTLCCHQLPPLLISFEIFHQLVVVRFLFCLFAIDSHAFLLSRIAKNPGGVITGFRVAHAFALLICAKTCRYLLITMNALSFTEICDCFGLFSLQVEDVLLSFIAALKVFITILCHSLLKLRFVVFLGHFSVKHEFLVQRVSEHDLRRHGGRWHV